MTREDDSPTIEDRSETLEDLLEALGIVALPDDWLEAGTVLAGRYRLEEQVGRSGAAMVFRVTDLSLQETAALKLLGARTSEVTIKSIREQVRRTRRVTHPNVTRIHDMGDHGGRYFVTMELVEGESLAELLARDGALSPQRTAIIGAQLAAGVEAAHAKGVLHRGLKPSNVLIAPDWRVVVTDFGIARVLQSEAIEDAEHVIGRPLYLAPEQFAGSPEDEKTDIYGLGLLLYEMLTGGLPFPNGGFEETGAARMRWPAPDPRKGGVVPDELAEIVLGCLSIEAKGRPDSVGAVRRALEASLGELPAGTASSPGKSPVPSPVPPIPVSDLPLAVLPLAYRGPVEHIALGQGVTEALIDMLSRTRGQRVLSYAATAKFKQRRDLDYVREGLGDAVDAIVDGTAQVSGDRAQVTARVVAVDTGVQLWSAVFESDEEDPLARQQSLATRIAEALRVETQAARYRGRVPEEALELFVAARRSVVGRLGTDYEPAVESLARCLDLAPDMTPAVALHALASVRATWTMGASSEELGARATKSLARARDGAAALAETHLAHALLLANNGAYQEAAETLARALEIAPTCALAHQIMGDLQVKAGRAKEGLRRLRLSLELDPSLHHSRLYLARHAALHGERETYESHVLALSAEVDVTEMPLLASRMRAALYFGDLDEVAKLSIEAEKIDGPHGVLAAQIGRYVLGDVDVENFDTLSTYAINLVETPRMRAVVDQMLAEAHATRGDTSRALRSIGKAAEGALVDIEWLRHCPALEPLRGHRDLAPFLDAVGQRARQVWATSAR